MKASSIARSMRISLPHYYSSLISLPPTLTPTASESFTQISSSRSEKEPHGHLLSNEGAKSSFCQATLVPKLPAVAY
ncbi:hypothetical protein BCD67_24540 [Oscillatoriales cyanobacterium USR001]|nr:hypothetical protein BCD67_24540 [Oscillatoriales cyanobacterium USR001]